jgi:hypothetical protein
MAGQLVGRRIVRCVRRPRDHGQPPIRKEVRERLGHSQPDEQQRTSSPTHRLRSPISAPSTPLEQPLSQVRELDEMAVDLTDAFYWGVFKLSGLVGDPVPALA